MRKSNQSVTEVISLKFPQTRFQGSKYKLIRWIHKSISDLAFDSVLDGFSGSGVVSYYFKSLGKEVYSNDILSSSYITSQALVENSFTLLTDQEIARLLRFVSYDDHGHTVEKNFRGVYFTQDENIWIDSMLYNISNLEGEYKRVLAYWSLFQSCIIKRPFNLFHRKNLSLRMSNVRRKFGNKVTWDRTFTEYFTKFCKQANACIFDNKRNNTAINCDISLIQGNFDLIYLDPPYMKSRRSKGTDYQDYYNFLEGLIDYENWEKRINLKKKHLPYEIEKSAWIDSELIYDKFSSLFEKFDGILVLSYHDLGFPSIKDLTELLHSVRKNVRTEYLEYQYVLSPQKVTKEALIIAK